MQIPLESIYFPAKLRLRSETYGDIDELARSLLGRGQLMPLLVRPPDPETFPDDANADDKPWILVDGGRRFLAFMLILRAYKDQYVSGLTPGNVEAIVKEDIDDPLVALAVEFHINEDREAFSWRERAEYVRRCHAMCEERYKDEGWSVEHTAEFLGMGTTTTYKYLQLTEDDEVLGDERVSGASTFRAAYKQAQIVKEHKRRERAVKFHEAQRATSGDERLINPSEFALRLVTNEDCREWIKRFPDDEFDWIHWDPPYGGEQGGGYQAAHERIDDSPAYAWGLMTDMIPELWRVLKPGRWLVMWFHPTRWETLKYALQGHVAKHMKGVEGALECANCGSPWQPYSLGDSCPKAPHPFWVNPYPNIWYKVNRMSDGHEIRRFLTNAYECFLFAAKVSGDREPILQLSNRQNVFAHEVVSKSERRHIMHKPSELLAEILSCISIPGEVGIDPSVGSGSLLEAAWSTGRRALACESSQEYWLGAVEALQTTIESLGVKV